MFLEQTFWMLIRDILYLHEAKHRARKWGEEGSKDIAAVFLYVPYRLTDSTDTWMELTREGFVWSFRSGDSGSFSRTCSSCFSRENCRAEKGNASGDYNSSRNFVHPFPQSHVLQTSALRCNVTCSSSSRSNSMCVCHTYIIMKRGWKERRGKEKIAPNHETGTLFPLLVCLRQSIGADILRWISVICFRSWSRNVNV